MVPKILHQIWLGPKPRPQEWMLTWAVKHPRWNYCMWTESNLPRLRNQGLYDAYGSEYAGKADLIRYEVLHAMGGVYIDADAECLRPIDDLIAGIEDSFAVYENETARPGLIANGFLGACPGNRLMTHLIDEIEARFAVQGAALVASPPWVITGPMLLTEVVEGYTYTDLRVLPSWTFLPEHFTGLKHTGTEQSYARHYWQTTRELHAGRLGP